MKDIDMDETDEINAKEALSNNEDVYLIVANNNEEFALSLRYTARLAAANNAHVGILATIDEQEFQHWQNVENMMRRELRDKTEKEVWTIAKKVQSLNGQIPVIYVREGKSEDAVLKTLEEEPNIKMIILTGSVASGGPGKLVDYFTSKGLSKLKVPLVLVPGNIQTHEIDELFDIKTKE